MNAQHDAMHDSNERILPPEIGGKRDNPRLSHLLQPIRMPRASQANQKAVPQDGSFLNQRTLPNLDVA
jgi:hypothetical protein